VETNIGYARVCVQLNEEHQKQHLRDLEQLQAQHLNEFNARLEAAKAETARLHQEREAERTALAHQREQERVMVERWSADKDTQLDSLRTHFLQREQLLVESARNAEARAAEAREHSAKSSLAEIEVRDRERREWDQTRSDYARQVSALLQEKTTLAEAVARRTLELESAQRQAVLLTEENVRYKARLAEANERLALVDSLQSQVARLQADAAMAADERVHRDNQLREQNEELAHRESRLKQLQSQLEAREQQRR